MFNPVRIFSIAFEEEIMNMETFTEFLGTQLAERLKRFRVGCRTSTRFHRRWAYA